MSRIGALRKPSRSNTCLAASMRRARVAAPLRDRGTSRLPALATTARSPAAALGISRLTVSGVACRSGRSRSDARITRKREAPLADRAVEQLGYGPTWRRQHRRRYRKEAGDSSSGCREDDPDANAG